MIIFLASDIDNFNLSLLDRARALILLAVEGRIYIFYKGDDNYGVGSTILSDKFDCANQVYEMVASSPGVPAEDLLDLVKLLI